MATALDKDDELLVGLILPGESDNQQSREDVSCDEHERKEIYRRYSEGAASLISKSTSSTENSNLLNIPHLQYGTMYPSSWSNSANMPPEQENRPRRKPYHHPSRKLSTTEDPGEYLYTRMRYYSRLRAPAPPSEHALVMPDHVIPIDLFLPFIPGKYIRDSEGKQSSVITM